MRVPTVQCLCLMLCSLGACSGNPSEPKLASSGKSDPITSRGGAEEDTTPLTPVAAPKGVVLRMRIKNPSFFLNGIFGAASLPYGWRDFVRMNDIGELYLSAFDAEGALELAVVMNPRSPAKFHPIVSVGVQGKAPVIKILENQGIATQKAAGGVYLFALEGEPCALGPAIGGSPARVVCSDEEASLLQFLPYALRGLPIHELSEAAGHLEVDMRTIREAYGENGGPLRAMPSAVANQIPAGNTKYDTALAEAVNGVAKEASALLEHTEYLKLQLFEEFGTIRLLFSMGFSGRSSSFVQSLLDLERVQQISPPLFDSLPGTASAASFGRELPSERVEPWSNVLAKLLSGRAELEGVSEVFSSRLARLVRSIASKGAEYVVAKGPLVESSRDGKKGAYPAWSLVGTERKKEELIRSLDDLSWLMASKERLKISPELQILPSLRLSPKKLEDAPDAVVYEWTLPEEFYAIASANVDGLGNEMLVRVAEFFIMEKLSLFSKGFVAVRQVGEHSWISWGREISELAESFRVLELKGRETVGNGVFGPLRSQVAFGGGFTNLAGVASALSWLAPPVRMGGWWGLVPGTPGGGAWPMYYISEVRERCEARERCASGPELRWELVAPPDFAVLLVLIAAELSGAPFAGSSNTLMPTR